MEILEDFKRNEISKNDTNDSKIEKSNLNSHPNVVELFARSLQPHTVSVGNETCKFQSIGACFTNDQI